MSTISKGFHSCAMGVLVAAAFAPAGASADEAVDKLRSEVEALRREVRDARQVAPAQPAQDRSVSLLGGSVTIYGTLNADAGTVQRTGATSGGAPLNSMVGAPGATPTDVPRRYTLRSNSSNLGVRGTRSLSGGLSAVFQLESALGLDGNASTLLGRDTFAGLSHATYGALLYGGNIDSPYKRGVQGKDPFYATGIASQKGILGSPGFNVASVNAVAGTTVGGNAAGSQQQNAGFDARLNNLVMYRSPVLGGFSAELAYGLNENKATSTGAQIDPNVWSVMGRYEAKGLFASYAYERRADVFGLNSLLTFVPGTGVTGAAFALPAGAASTDTGSKLGVGYAFGGTELLGVWERLSYRTNFGTVTEYRRDAVVGSISQRLGSHRLIASYGQAGAGRCALASGEDCSTTGLGARQLALGYDYSLDRDTSLYAFWSKIANDSAAAYNFGVSGAPAAGVGADPQALALGIRYRF